MLPKRTGTSAPHTRRPCPFCGSTRTSVQVHIRWERYTVVCLDCRGKSGMAFTHSAACDKWNDRVIPCGCYRGMIWGKDPERGPEDECPKCNGTGYLTKS